MEEGGESPFLKRQEGLRFEYGFLRHIPCPLPKTNITTHAIIYIQHTFDLINLMTPNLFDSTESRVGT